MPVTVVVGGQFGSEGKGKVAHWLADEQKAEYAVRVGGPNSAHTALKYGNPRVLRQLPTAILTPNVVGVIPAGAYIDIKLLRDEMDMVGLDIDKLLIDAKAVVLDESMRAEEREAGLIDAVASTGRGVGSALARRTMRSTSVKFAGDRPDLHHFVRTDLTHILADALTKWKRVVVEGTHGFGLSVLHGRSYPYATSRDTTAAGALSEAGLSPMDVDCVALTIRTFPVRSSGNSGPLPLETSWEEVNRGSGAKTDFTEYATETGQPRRVARFHEDVVRDAISVNRPNLLFLNHVDYFDPWLYMELSLSDGAAREVHKLECRLGRGIDYVGVDAGRIIRRPVEGWLSEAARQEVASAG